MRSSKRWSPICLQDKPRYLMGVGTPSNIIEGVARGVDFFDCVMPARNARHGKLFTWEGTMNIKNEKYKTDRLPHRPGLSAARPAAAISRAYLRHLFKAEEMLAMRLLVMHNLWFYNELMQKIRDALDEGQFAEFRAEYSEKLAQTPVIFRKRLAKFPRTGYNKTNCRVQMRIRR